MDKNRIIVTVCANENTVSFQTKAGKTVSPQWFYVSRDEMEKLQEGDSILTSDIRSFARLWLDRKNGLLEMNFTWLSGNDHQLEGFCQTVRLPWEKLQTLLATPLEGSRGQTWKCLSQPAPAGRPRIVFRESRNLSAALADKTTRRSLCKALMKHFQWPYSDEIWLYDDFEPRSFFFREVKDGKPNLCGGLLLHDRGGRMDYDLHT